MHVSQLLLEGAREGAYDGLIIIAAPAVAAELEDALAPETRALLIGEIVHDHTIPARADVYVVPELRH
jgi:protein required for attachment to host cells